MPVLALHLVTKFNLVGEVDGSVQDDGLKGLARGLTSEGASQELLGGGLDERCVHADDGSC